MTKRELPEFQLMRPNARVNRRQAAKRVDVLLNNQLGQFLYCFAYHVSIRGYGSTLVWLAGELLFDFSSVQVVLYILPSLLQNPICYIN
jgi:hypothetical protein